MKDIILYTAGTTQSIRYATQWLSKYGYVFTENTTVLSPTHILLDIPSKQSAPVNLNDNITIIGGNLQSPNQSIDLLQNPQYLAQNALITAHCALKIAMQNSEHILPEQNILIIGWGRIGKCLAQILLRMGCHVTVAARKETDLALLSALGFNAIPTYSIIPDCYSLIFNTVPELLIQDCTASATVIDLASKPGITGSHVITARGLPGKEAPASSGKLIADTIHRILSRKE